jgi:hypothetical protein
MMKISSWFSVLVLLVLASCGSKEADTVDFDELSPNSKPRKHSELSVDSVSNEKPKESVYLSLIDSLRPEDTWQKWDTILFPDRFGASKTEKWIVKGDNDSLVLLYFKFRDSLLTKNAFYNWIDCFGPKCKSYTVGGNIKIKGKYSYFFVGDSYIYYLEASKAIKPEIIRSHTYGKGKPEKENWLYMVEAKPMGKTVWKRIVKGEEREIKNSYENFE